MECHGELANKGGIHAICGEQKSTPMSDHGRAGAGKRLKESGWVVDLVLEQMVQVLTKVGKVDELEAPGHACMAYYR